MSIALLTPGMLVDTYRSFDWKEFKSKTINVVMEYKSRFTPAFFESRQWTVLKNRTKEAVWSTTVAIAACLLYWQTPGLFWTSLGVSARFPHVMRESTEKIKNVWNQQKGLTCALLCVGACLALPQTLIACSILMGADVGSNLQITSTALLAIKEYKEFVKPPLTDGQEDAFLQFLTEDRHILIYNDLYKNVRKLKALQQKQKDPRFAALPFYRTMQKVKSQILDKQAKLLDKLDKHRYECTVTETIDALVLSVLPHRGSPG